MERYKQFSGKIFDKPTQRYRLKSTFYPSIPFRDSDIYIISRAGQRLDLLAYQYYRDATLWWVIATANHMGKGKFNITPGKRMRIPYPMDLQTLNTIIEDEQLT